MVRSRSGAGCLPRTKELRTEERRRAAELNEVALNRLGIKVEREKNRAGKRLRDEGIGG